MARKYLKDYVKDAADFVTKYEPAQKVKPGESAYDKKLPELKHGEMFGKKKVSRPAAGGRSLVSSAKAGESSVPKMARATGKGGRAAGSAGARPQGNPFKSGKYAAKGMAPVQAAAKAAKKAKPKADIGSLANWKTTVKPEKRGSREELGDFYLNATSGMFSDKAGGRRKK